MLLVSNTGDFTQVMVDCIRSSIDHKYNNNSTIMQLFSISAQVVMRASHSDEFVRVHLWTMTVQKVRDVRSDSDVQIDHQSDVLEAIKSLPTKQCDLDPMPTWLLKANSPFIILFLTELFNKLLLSGDVPLYLKSAYIIPRLKKTIDRYRIYLS